MSTEHRQIVTVFRHVKDGRRHPNSTCIGTNPFARECLGEGCLMMADELRVQFWRQQNESGASLVTGMGKQMPTISSEIESKDL